MHYVNYGLEDISEESTIQFLYLDSIQNFLRITNFKEMTMTNEIAVTIRVINVTIISPPSLASWATLHHSRFMSFKTSLSTSCSSPTSCML